jgi:hypothetical protein
MYWSGDCPSSIEELSKMNFNLLPFTVLWMALALVVIGLIGYRKWIARAEDDTLHIAESEIGMASQQMVVAQRLDMIDRWGKALTVVALVYGLAVTALFLFQTWLRLS